MSAMESPVVVASNRGPVSFEHNEQGKLEGRRGSGGLVTALSGVFFRDDATWVAAAITDGDRSVGPKGPADSPDSRQRVRYVVVPRERYEGYYNQIANRIMWFVHHQPVGHGPRADLRRRDRDGLGVVHRDEPAVRAPARRRGRPRSRLSGAGLPPVPRAGDAARTGARREDRALLAHAVRRRDVPADPPGRHARQDRARHGRRRRDRLPVASVGRELPFVGSNAAGIPRAAGRAHRAGRPPRSGPLVPGGRERSAAARNGEHGHRPRDPRGARGLARRPRP